MGVRLLLYDRLTLTPENRRDKTIYRGEDKHL